MPTATITQPPPPTSRAGETATDTTPPSELLYFANDRVTDAAGEFDAVRAAIFERKLKNNAAGDQYAFELRIAPAPSTDLQGYRTWPKFGVFIVRPSNGDIGFAPGDTVKFQFQPVPTASVPAHERIAAALSAVYVLLDHLEKFRSLQPDKPAPPAAVLKSMVAEMVRSGQKTHGGDEKGGA